MGLFGSSFSDPYEGYPSAFNVDDMRQEALWRGLQQAGLALMNPDPNLPPSFARSLGRGLGGFAQGTDAGRQAYEQQAMTGMKMQEYQSAQAAEKRKQEALTDLLGQTDLAPELRNWIMANPDHAWDVIKPQFETPKEPEPFTLGEGQTRFGGTGKPIATVPKAAEKPTSGIQEYNFAKSQGYTGTFQQYQMEMKKAGGTTVNVGPNGEDFGQPGPGLVWARDPKTRQILLDEQGLPIAMPFKGGKAYEEKLAAELAAKQAAGAKAQTSGIVTQDVDRAIKMIEQNPSTTTGLVGEWMSGIGGTQSRNVRALLDTIKANAGFDKLQAMRDASPTGGALGQVSEREMAYLQATIGNLEQSQTPQQLLENLRRVREAYAIIIDGQQAARDDRQPSPTEFNWTPEGGLQ